MSISEKNQPRLVLIVVLLVFGSIMAYSLNVESKPKIDVEEGYEEIGIRYMQKLNTGKTYKNITTGEWYKNATANTYVDGKNNTLEFKLIAESIEVYSDNHEIDFSLLVEGDFKEKYDLKNFLFRMQELNGKNVSRNHHDFDTSFVKGNNVDLWPVEKRKDGSRGTRRAFIGFDINENKFTAEGHIKWTIPKSNWNNTYTLRLESVVRGMSEDVTATVDVTVRGREIG